MELELPRIRSLYSLKGDVSSRRHSCQSIWQLFHINWSRSEPVEWHIIHHVLGGYVWQVNGCVLYWSK